MKNRTKRNRLIASIICILLVISMLIGTVITAFADEVKIVTLGADLSDEQRTLILNYFNVNENEVEIVTVNNEDEHHYLDGIATPQQIGTHTYSCTYIEPTHEGGIHIKTVNLNWVTCEMIRNALVTSGITNCNVVCAAPKEMSGTGALTGIFKAYETVTDEKLDETKVELASQELVETMELSEDIGQDEATTLMSTVKEEVIVQGLTSTEEISESLETYLENNKIELTDEQKDALIQLMLDISKQEYSVDDVKNAYQDIKETVQTVKDTTEEAMNFFERIWNWITTTWQKITGTYDKIASTEEAQAVKEQLGILAQTNDSLLGDNTVVTITEEQDLLDEASDVDDVTTEEKTSIIDNIVKFFKEFFGGTVDEPNTVEETETIESDTESSEAITFDNIDNSSVVENEIVEESTETIDEETEQEEFNVLDHVNWDMQNDTESIETSDGTPTLDDLTK